MTTAVVATVVVSSGPLSVELAVAIAMAILSLKARLQAINLRRFY